MMLCTHETYKVRSYDDFIASSLTRDDEVRYSGAEWKCVVAELKVTPDEMLESLLPCRDRTQSQLEPSLQKEALKVRFSELVDEWKSGTGFMSSPTDIAMYPAYQRIIGMGFPVVPLILREMSSRRGQWFWALRAITGENPVLAEHRGNVKKMTKDWLELGRQRGWI